MHSIMNVLRVLLAKLVTGIYTFISAITTGSAVKTEPKKVPEDFTPVIRFSVCSDIHLDGEKDENQPEALRLRQMFDTVYAYADKDERYKGLDAFCVAGDFATNGRREEYELFKKIINEKLRNNTKLLTTIGNHEYINTRDYDASLSARLYEQMMGTDLDTHTVINGYHFICVSYDDNGKTFSGKKEWLRLELDKAVADTGKKPVFVFNHAAPFGTVYGSITWGDLSLAEVLSEYPQAVDFSGHSHYPINDPRSIWQGTFTALGCGTLSYYETDLDYISGNFPYKTDKAAQFYIVEADKNGNVRILAYDLITKRFFNVEYYLKNLADKNYEYAFNNMKKRDNAPVFSSSTKVTTYLNDKGETILEFDGATDKYIVESYKVSVTNKSGITVARDNFSGKYMYLFENNTYTVNLGVLKNGIYKAQITAMNAYAKTSENLNYSFTVK